MEIHKSNKPSKSRPDSFIAIPFAHKTHCRQTVDHFQSKLINASPHLKGTLVDPNTLHITLGVMKIGRDPRTMQLVEEALKKAVKSVQSLVVQPVQFDGIETFRKSVVYMKPNESSERMLKDMYDCVRPHFETIVPLANEDASQDETSSTQGSMVSSVEGIQDSIWMDSGTFVPHMTIAKCSLLKGSVRNWWSYKFDTTVSDEEEEPWCVTEAVDQLQVCSMHGRKKGEYYKIIAQESLTCGDNS